MGDLQHVILLLGLLALRIGLPLAVIAGLGYVLKRLDERWQAEAAQAGRGRSHGVPRRHVPAIEGGAMLASAPCWVLRDCDPVLRADCPAWLRPELPCWLARMEAGFQLPSLCTVCPLFVQTVGQD